jgi:hypothetical protein
VVRQREPACLEDGDGVLDRRQLLTNLPGGWPKLEQRGKPVKLISERSSNENVASTTQDSSEVLCARLMIADVMPDMG